MRLFALSDLHLSLAASYLPGSGIEPQLTKPMSVFGARWCDYFARLEANWLQTVSAEDTVLLAGDLSWAMTLAEARYDLAYLGALPGKKILIKGNHDYWWQSLSQVEAVLPAGITVLQHSAVTAGGYAVCGTRGWLLPQHTEFKESEDRKLYERELLRLRMALLEAKRLDLPIIVMLHYPPLLQEKDESGFSDLLEAFQVKLCVYGHIHGDKAAAFCGERNGVRYENSSIDRLDFQPLCLFAEGNSALP